MCYKCKGAKIYWSSRSEQDLEKNDDRHSAKKSSIRMQGQQVPWLKTKPVALGHYYLHIQWIRNTVT